ncbi:MAG: radical SAM protein [Acidobacteriota bacterium]
MHAPESWLFPLFTDRDTYDRSMPRLSDVHLYTGSRCNRRCGFCIVDGRPDGGYQPLTAEALDAVFALVPPDGTIKFYGGEPTLDLPNLLWSMTYLRQRGFDGWFTIFTNGVQAERVIAALEHDARTDVVLNYSILHGVDADPLPPGALTRLRAYAEAHPGRIYSSHAGVFPFGPGARFADEVGQAHLDDRMRTSLAKKIASGVVSPAAAVAAAERNYRICPRCRPVVTSDGRHHACPFAVESRSPHFDLGAVHEPAPIILRRYQQFLDWIGEVLEPEAERRLQHPCRVCTEGLAPLPVYTKAG